MATGQGIALPFSRPVPKFQGSSQLARTQAWEVGSSCRMAAPAKQTWERPSWSSPGSSDPGLDPGGGVDRFVVIPKAPRGALGSIAERSNPGKDLADYLYGFSGHGRAL